METYNTERNQSDIGILSAYMCLIVLGLHALAIDTLYALTSNALFILCLAILVVIIALGLFTIYKVWMSTLSSKQALKNRSIYPYKSFDKSTLFLFLILVFTVVAIITLALIQFDLLIGILAIENIAILVLLYYKKKSGIYGIAINEECIRVASSSLIVDVPLRSIVSIEINKTQLCIYHKCKLYESPISIQLSMLHEHHKLALVKQLQQHVS